VGEGRYYYKGDRLWRTLNFELETLRSALPLSPLGYAAYMSEASLKKGVGRLKELETWNLKKYI